MSELVFILNDADWPVLLVDAEGQIHHSNAAAIAVFGAPAKSGTGRLTDIWSAGNTATPKDFLADWSRAAHGTAPLKCRGQNGNPILFIPSLCSFTHDNRELFLLQLLPPPLPKEEQPATTHADPGNTAIIQKQKLDCALQLARTMALDFNNALTSILGHTSLLLGRAEPTHPWRASLVEVEKSAARAAEIAADLAAFSRQEKEPRAQAAGNLNQLLQRTVDAFENASPGKSSWQLQLGRKLYAAKFDEAKMQQVFTKIFENAMESLGRDGRITVQSRNLDLTAPTQDRNVQLAAGSYICAEITDTGSGIAADILPRIFEPFFTTKKAPHRGLGLAWVYGVVTNHGGGVAVSSQIGVGTSVRVYLPADNKIVQAASFDNNDLKGTQTILMVDDEDLLLTMGQAIMSSFGYKVVTANSGQKALEILAKNDPAIDLLITDLVMPGMSGRELVDQARKILPDLRILCTSGYVFPGKDEQDIAYLQKPFTSRELLAKVKNALAEQEE